MMKSKSFILALLIALGCSYSEKNVNPKSENTIDELLDALKPAPEVFFVEQGDWFQTKTGIYFRLPWTGFKFLDGTSVTGKIRFEVSSMLNIGSMIAHDIHTMGPEGLFRSGSQYSIKASSDGKPVILNPADGNLSVNIPVTPRNVQIDTFLLWNGIRNSNGSLSWTPINPGPDTSFFSTRFTRSTGVNTAIPPDTNRHLFLQQLPSPNMNLINLDIYYPINVPKTPISIQLPAEFNENNTLSFITIPSINSCIKLDQYQFGLKGPFGNYFPIPIGLGVQIIVVAKRGNQYYFHEQYEVTAEPFSKNVTPHPSTLAEIKAALKLN